MNKISLFFIVFVTTVAVFFIGFKVGDSRGFEAGYKAGYIYDCQAEVKALRQQHEDLKKAVEFARKKSSQVQLENARIRYSRDHYQDSLNNVERVKYLQDSISKLSPSRQEEVSVNPYTGEVRNTVKGIMRMYREAQKK